MRISAIVTLYQIGLITQYLYNLVNKIGPILVKELCKCIYTCLQIKQVKPVYNLVCDSLLSKFIFTLLSSYLLNCSTKLIEPNWIKSIKLLFHYWLVRNQSQNSRDNTSFHNVHFGYFEVLYTNFYGLLLGI